MTRTFIFDLGNVIVPFDINIGLENVANVCDLSNEEIRERLFAGQFSQDYHSGKTSEQEFYESVQKSLNLRLNFEEFADAWNTIFSPEPIIPDEFIEKLSRKYRLIVLSDTNKLHFEFIRENYPVLRHFNDFVLSHEVGSQKPSPEIFDAAIEKAKCLPEECFYTDDNKTYTEKARDFGINAVQFISFDQFEEVLRSRRLVN